MGEDNRPPPTDAELVARAKAEETEAFGELYTRYVDLIYRFVRSRVSSDVDAEDLTEVVFLRSFKAVGRYEERGLPFSAFLYQVARRVLVDHYRKVKDEVPLEEASLVGTANRAMDERMARNERSAELTHALAKIAPDYREVIRLRVLLAMPTATVAVWMGRSEGAIRVLLYRALKALREEMVEDDG